MLLEQFIELRPVYASRLNQLPRTLSAPSSSRLEGQRGQVFRPDHPHRHAVVIEHSCRGHSIFGESIMGGKKLDWHRPNYVPEERRAQ